jgi:D-cysteine desulfhydrase family pyridoxal phosphate-dependent enzyme
MQNRLEPYTPPTWAQDLANLPTHRCRLAMLPTPVERWSPPGFPGDIECWIKRDDCTGNTLSGNKVRKLEFLLADALNQGCDTILTCGGIQSNHARATAVAARQLGMDSHLFLRSGDTDSDPGLTGNLLLDRMVGALMHLITAPDYARRNDLMAEAAGQLESQGRKPYIIPEGGSNGLGSWGYLEAVREIQEQAASMNTRFDDIVFGCGSGGTAAGLSLGISLAGLSTRVHAVNVCDDAAYFYGRVGEILEELGATGSSQDLLHVIDGHVGNGYALSTTDELQYFHEVAAATGIILDPVYSGKALYGLCQEANLPERPFAGHRILFLHTGGLFGLYDKLEQLAAVIV